MDYARKIGKSDKPPNWLKGFTTTVAVSDGLICREHQFTEDRRSVNWKKWLERRKKQYERTESATGRHQNDQIINSCETVREKIEMRNLIDYATVPVPIIPDKYRGGPEFWRTPQTLPKRGDLCLPEIAFTPNKKELNIAPTLTYVDLPELTEKEKHLTGLKSKEPLWKRSRYLAKRRKQLSKEIKLLVPKEPETKDLVIKNYVAPRVDAQPRTPPITISDAEESDEENSCFKAYPEQAIVLKIQDHEIVCQRFAPKNDQTEPEPITWSVVFSANVNERVEKEIVFENKGNRVIVCQWRDGAVRCSSLPLKRRISPFFFNKTKEVILPGQIVRLKVWYRPRSSGVSTEFWKLITSPVLCSSPLIFRFWGCAETASLETVKRNSVQLVDKYLDRCVRDTAVREIIRVIMENVDSVEYPEPGYGSLFLESEVFVAKNPLCFYNPSVLIEFHKIYHGATNQKEHRWNMSLNDLREILLRTKPLERRNIMLSEFGKLYKECLKPTLYSFVEYNKHEVVYSLLCSFFNLFEIVSMTAMGANYAKECAATVREPPAIRRAISRVVFRSFVENNDLQGRGLKTDSSTRICQGKRSDATSIVTSSSCAYKDTFFIYIYQLLGETLVRVFATIESFDNLNERNG